MGGRTAARLELSYLLTHHAVTHPTTRQHRPLLSSTTRGTDGQGARASGEALEPQLAPPAPPRERRRRARARRHAGAPALALTSLPCARWAAPSATPTRRLSHSSRYPLRAARATARATPYKPLEPQLALPLQAARATARATPYKTLEPQLALPRARHAPQRAARGPRAGARARARRQRTGHARGSSPSPATSAQATDDPSLEGWAALRHYPTAATTPFRSTPIPVRGGTSPSAADVEAHTPTAISCKKFKDMDDCWHPPF